MKEKAHHAATDSAVVKKAEDMVSSMLAKGLVLGKDAVNKAKAFDERHRLISNASATVASIDRKIGISEKLSIGEIIQEVLLPTFLIGCLVFLPGYTLFLHY